MVDDRILIHVSADERQIVTNDLAADVNAVVPRADCIGQTGWHDKGDIEPADGVRVRVRENIIDPVPLDLMVSNCGRAIVVKRDLTGEDRRSQAGSESRRSWECASVDV